jgi:hypothetical protein
MNELIIGGFALSGIIVAVVQVLKGVGLPSKFAGLVSMLIGVGVGVAVYFEGTVEMTLLGAIFLGLATGLMASGAYSGTQAFINKEEKK